MSPAASQWFELEHGVELPCGYREFITKTGDGDAGHAGVEIDATTLSLILNGVELASARRNRGAKNCSRIWHVATK